MLSERPTVYGEDAPYREAGQWLRNLRRYWQITEAELAEQIGTATAEIVADIEAGRLRLPRSMYPSVARAYSMDEQEFAESCDLYFRAAPGIARSAA